MEETPAAAAAAAPGEPATLAALTFRSAKRSRDLFVAEHNDVPSVLETAAQARRGAKVRAEYQAVLDAPKSNAFILTQKQT
jgi:hypothetical protein